jgi:hypothetical protein
VSPPLGEGAAVVMTLLCGTGNAAEAALAKGAKAIVPPIAVADNHGATYLIIFFMALLPSVTPGHVQQFGCLT